MIAIVFVVLALAGLCFFVRLVMGPSLADRIVALDGLIITVVAAIVVEAVRSGSPRFLDAVVVIALVGFVGTTAAARFVEQRGG